MSEHGLRDHATWAASSTERNWNCPGALALGRLVEKLDVESEAAAWGTACHQISEKCLRSGKDAADLIDTVEVTKSHQFTVDDEMAACAQEYIDYVRTIGGYAPDDLGDFGWSRLVHIEQRFSLEKLDPPFDAGGTADAVVYNSSERLLEVVDLKGGRGVVVEVDDNKQLRTYALGAMLANTGITVKQVRSTIVQPRAPHKDGRIRSETFHIADLMEWTGDLVAAMRKSAEAVQMHEKITGEVSREQWAERYLCAGSHCTFCPAAGICPALEKKATEAAGLWFDADDQPKLKNMPDDLSPERLAQVLDMADMIQNWLNACRALATRLADTGTEIPGYQLVEKIGNRKWKLEGVDLENELAEKADLAKYEIYAPAKVKSPAQIEKVLGAKRKGLIDDLVERPVTGTSLVSKSKTTKPAKASKVEAFFTSAT